MKLQTMKVKIMKASSLTGDIKPFVLEISPVGSRRERGHSFADGTYLNA